jgi:hypothetical protein
MNVSIDADAELRLRQLAARTGLPMNGLASWAIKELWAAYQTGRWTLHQTWVPKKGVRHARKRKR